MNYNFTPDGQLTLDKRVQLKPYVARAFKSYELATDEEIIAGGGGTLIVDTENYPNYNLIAFKDIKTKKIIKFEITKNTHNPRKLSWIMQSYRTISFNGIKYDLPLIWLSYYTQDLAQLKSASNDLISGMWLNEFQAKWNFKVTHTNMIDLIEVCPGIHSLKLYMGRLHCQRIQDVPFSPYHDLTPEQIDVVSDYCVNDLDGTQELFEFNKERITLREQLSLDYKVDLRSKSDAQMAEAMVAKELKNKTGNWPKKADLDTRYHFNYEPPPYLRFVTPQLQKLFKDVCDTEFTVDSGMLYRPKMFESYYFQLGNTEYKFGIGGLHSHEKCISFKADDNNLIIDRDVTGYYPNIITTLNLYPEQLGTPFLDVFNKMKLDREHAKLHKIFTKDKGLKIATNGISGKLNSEYSIFFSPKCYLQMTLTGQLSILMLAEMFECNGIQIISANTDGIVSYCRQKDYETFLYWIGQWEKMVEFRTEETQYKSYFARDVNAYFAVKLDGSVKVKGPYSEVGSQTGTKLDNNPIHLICSDAVKELLSKSTPIEKTIHECTDLTRFITVRNVKGGAHKNGEYLGKTIRWYYAKNELGIINRIDSGNKVPETEGAKPVMDLPEQFPSDINYEWYVDKTKNILEDIGYTVKAKQMRFW